VGVNRRKKGAANTLAALKSIRAARPDGAPIYVVLDNLSAHKGADIRRSSWNRTGAHLDAARVHLPGQPNVDLSATLEFLERNELGLAFDLSSISRPAARLLAAPRSSSQ
jgi:hypothetical protein